MGEVSGVSTLSPPESLYRTEEPQGQRGRRAVAPGFPRAAGPINGADRLSPHIRCASPGSCSVARFRQTRMAKKDCRSLAWFAQRGRSRPPRPIPGPPLHPSGGGDRPRSPWSSTYLSQRAAPRIRLTDGEWPRARSLPRPPGGSISPPGRFIQREGSPRRPPGGASSPPVVILVARRTPPW